MLPSVRRVVSLSFSPIERDPRLQRQISAIARDHDVLVVGYGTLGAAAHLSNVQMCSVRTPSPSRLRSSAVLAAAVAGRGLPDIGYWAWNAMNDDHREAERAIVAAKPALIVANEWKALPVAMRAAAACGAGVVADMHEYSPGLWDTDPIRKRLFGPLVDYHLRYASTRLRGASTVNQTIADRYAALYGLQCQVVRNIPDATERSAIRPTDGESIKLVHHGVASRVRRLDLMVEAVALCEPRYSLHFMLLDQDGHVQELRQLAQRKAPGRVHFEPVVQTHEIVPTIAQYDMGLFLLPPVTFSYHAALPNKFFEFLYAGLATCVGPSPEMAKLTHHHGCGIVTPSFNPRAAADALNRVTAAEIDRMKQQALAACRDLRSEHEAEHTRALVNRALDLPSA